MRYRTQDHNVALDAGLPGADGHIIAWTDLRPGRYMVSPAKPGRWDVAVARVSTDDQIREGCSFQQQISFALTAAAENEQDITAVYVDPGISATRHTLEERPGTRTLLEDIRRRKIRNLYVYKRDRVSRNTSEWITFLSTCVQQGVKIVITCPEELPVGQGAYGKFTETIIIATAELEAAITSMRVRDNMLGRFMDGRYTGGHLPYGLRLDENRVIRPDPDEAPIVTLIFQLATEEMLGDMRIAMRLNAQHSNSFRGHTWSRAMVRRVIRNRTYCGFFHLTVKAEDGKPTVMEQRSDQLPILIPEEQWLLANRMRASRVPSRGAEPSQYRASKSLLYGLVVCGGCGHLMKIRESVQRHRCTSGQVNEYRHRYYVCPRGQSIRRCDNRGTACATLIEDAVLRACSESLPRMDGDQIRTGIREYSATRRRQLAEQGAEAQAELSRLTRAIDRNQALFEEASSQQEVEYYQERLKLLIRQQTETHDRIAAIGAESRKLETNELDVKRLLTIAKEWPTRVAKASPSAKRKLLFQVLERVVWHPATRHVDIVFQLGTAGGDAQLCVSVPISKRQPQRRMVAQSSDSPGPVTDSAKAIREGFHG